MHVAPPCDNPLAGRHGFQCWAAVLLCSSVQALPTCVACRVEAVMREDRMLKAYEILELYLELLAVGALAGRQRSFAGDCVVCLSELGTKICASAQ